MIRSIEDAGAWLESLINLEKRRDWPTARLGLGPIHELLERLERPEAQLRVIHVAGSKGKGSTALLVEALLAACGERVGTFTSPHLERWTERLRIGGNEIGEAELAAAVERVRPHVEALRALGPGRAPTFFDATTAAACVAFRAARVDRAVLEVGLGGRLDSTNVVQPQVACITSIELEHTDRLGDTLEEVASEKAGILKPGAAAVVGVLPEPARAAVAARAAEIGVEPAWLGEDFHVEILEAGPGGMRARFRDGPVDFETTLPVLGRHQAGNAALALACVRRAGGLDDERIQTAAPDAFAGVSLPGRIEIVGHDPLRVVDAAHTAVSAQGLAEVLAGIERRRTRLVLSVSAGKHLEAILGALAPLVDEITATRAEPNRSLSPADVAAAARGQAPGVPVRVVPNPHLALRSAAEGLGPGDCLLATGSIYLAGIARRLLRDPAPERVAVTRSAPGPGGG